MKKFIEKILGSESERYLKKIKPLLNKINSLESKYEKYTDKELKEMTNIFKKQLQEGKTLDDILPDAFAVVREASKRVLGLRHFDVQILGGIVLHNNMIAEMKTGEGKTLVATLPAYLNALEGKGVHIVTVNDYLAQRDAEKMGKIYKFLGLTVGVITHNSSREERKKAYACDITYGTNNEFAFDYLRDNMVYEKEHIVQKGLHYAIIDEIDSILIDEARTPLIISSQGPKTGHLYPALIQVVKQLKAGYEKEENESKLVKSIKQKINKDIAIDNDEYDVIINEKDKFAVLTTKGINKIEKILKIDNIYDEKFSGLLHMINQALQAVYIMKKDIDYMVENNEVLIIDEFTGRVMYGRRFNNGLHQAIEAKEGVPIREEQNTIASITFQHYFKMYNKLAGMTGTAETEKDEFRYIYNLDVIVIPTNKPVIRKDMPDKVYKTMSAKEKAIIEDIIDCYNRGQPVLVGTITVQKSEELSKKLKEKGIPHNVLNAKNHKKEAEIIAQAGRFKAVTIATNMAGRGTDILLGGNPELLAKKEFYDKYNVSLDEIEDFILKYKYAFEEEKKELNFKEKEKLYEKYKEILEKYKKETEENRKKVIETGGLRVIGTTRHESRRIDNQLRGRSGRQGDVGSSQFYLSFEDDLIRLFGGESAKKIIEKLDFDENTPIDSPMIAKIIEKAQIKIEENNFAIRKNILDYDTVLNTQRNIIYDERRKILFADNVEEYIKNMMKDFAEEIGKFVLNEELEPENWDYGKLINEINSVIPNVNVKKEDIMLTKEELKQENYFQIALNKIYKLFEKIYEEKTKEIGYDLMKKAEKDILLKVITAEWQQHLTSMEYLKKSTSFISLSKVENPLYVYQKEAFELFEYLKRRIKERTLSILFQIKKAN